MNFYSAFTFLNDFFGSCLTKVDIDNSKNYIYFLLECRNLQNSEQNKPRILVGIFKCLIVFKVKFEVFTFFDVIEIKNGNL